MDTATNPIAALALRESELDERAALGRPEVDERAPLRRPEVDERAARAALRAQIARLEEQLAAHLTSAFPLSPTPPRVGGSRGARLQSLAELERQRDALSAALTATRRELDALGRRQEHARGRLERIMLDPAAHPWERVTHEDVGEPGCRQYHARPRLGPLGLLMDWWRVRISSGCPLCTRSADRVRWPPTARRSPPSSWSAASRCGSGSRCSGSGSPGA
jgi:hypothetical protein